MLLWQEVLLCTKYSDKKDLSKRSIDMEKIYAIWLSETFGAGSRIPSMLCEYYDSFEAIYNADLEEIALIEGVSAKHIEKLCNKSLGRAEEIMAECMALDIDLLTIYDDKYPEHLKNISDPPVLLYVKGKFPVTKNIPAIGIVGSRRPSNYGAKMSEKIAEDLGNRGFIIVSGMARGIDTCSHRGAIKAGTLTIAVLGCGVDVLYPPENGAIKSLIEQNGAVVSEFAPGTAPLPAHFPVRNRIVSGISQSVLVVEGKASSGSTITANLAKDQGRDVFCLPGNVDNPLSTASHALIRDGARLVTCAEDIIMDLGYMLVEERAENYVEANQERMNLVFDKLSDDQRKIAKVLESNTPMHIDEICFKSGVEIAVANQCLFMMELSGIVKQLPGKQYILSL